MTVATLIDGLTPLPEPNAAATASILRHRFPDAVVWFGCFTRTWWAMVPVANRERLFEGADPDEITRAIITGLTAATPDSHQSAARPR
jgi:hypothetical protein